MDQFNMTQETDADPFAASEYSPVLPPPLSEAEQRELVDRLKYEYDKFQRDISPLHETIKRAHELYNFSSKEEKEFPWPGAANFNVPLIMSTVDSIHARISKAVFEVDPLWLANARSPVAADLSKTAEKYLDYWADEMGLAMVLDMVILNMLLEGVGVLKLDWARRTRPIPTFQGVQGPSEVIEYDGPQASHVPILDFVLIPADAPTIEDAVYVGHRVFLTNQQLKQRRDQQFYFNVDELLERSSGDSTTEKTTNSLGIVATNMAGNEYEETNQYEIVEFYGPYDFGDGPTPALMTFSPRHEILLRIEPYPYQYGRPPYVDFQVYPRANVFWGRSVPDMLESSQEELTAMHNMRADAIAIRIAPPILRRMSAPWDPEEIPWAPGALIDVNDLAEVSQMDIADVPSSLFAHEQDTLAFVERVTGMSDYFMGRSPSQNRTATEVNRVTSEGLARMDVMVSRFQKGGMERLAWMLWWLLYQYRPFMDMFQADGQNLSINKMQMRPTQSGIMPFEFRSHGQLSDASKEARRQQKLMLLGNSGQFLSQFYPDGIQNLLRDIFGDFDIPNPDSILGPSWNVLQQQMQQAFQQGMQEGMKQAQQAQRQAE